MKKRVLALVTGVILALSALTGCESNIARAVEASRAAADISDFDYSQMYSEEEGYKYPDLKWGTTLTQLREKYGDNINTYSSFSSDGASVYTVDILGHKICNRIPESTDLAFDENEELYMVSLGFSGEDLGSAEESQSVLVSTIKSNVIELYGEPESEIAEDSVISDSEAKITTWKWKKTLPDGTTTEIQLAQAVVGIAAEPTYVSFGIVCTTPERQEKIDSAATEEESQNQ